MVFFGILVSVTAIGTMCWLLFHLAAFALPLFIGINAGIWGKSMTRSLAFTRPTLIF